MRAVTLAFVIAFVGGPALAQQKAPKESKAKTCTYEQCVATNTGKGWSSSQVSNWCSKNPGKCQ
jgi:hypothetical protein